MAEVYKWDAPPAERSRLDHGEYGDLDHDYNIGAAHRLASFEEYLAAHGIIKPHQIPPLRHLAAQQGVCIIEVLLAADAGLTGAVYRALAAFSELAFLDPGIDWFHADIATDEVEICLAQGWVRLLGTDGRHYYAAAPRRPDARLLRHLGAAGDRASSAIDFVATPATIRHWIEAAHTPTLTDMATNTLRRALPGASAHIRLVRWQIIALIAAVFTTATTAIFALPWLIATMVVLLSAVFLVLTLLRVMCLFIGLGGCGRHPRRQIADRDLPVYTLLVPLFEEATVVGQLTKALMALDYPASKLDIKLILESHDHVTRAAVTALNLPGCFDIIVVPDSQPRTKPKALNYGFRYARGAFVAVYDAEDIPEPVQLRKSLAAFAAGPDNLGCVQARLGFYNSRRNWLTRQFAIEYAALFDALLPALAKLDMPLMLGGTSNHFRAQALRRAGGWDPYNVTEDADLGIRFARMGYRCAWLDSITLEEAPAGLAAWLQQRVRWMRGWLQTYFVHMRAPRQVFHEMGFWKFVGFQTLVGGLVISALAHPIFLMYLITLLVFSDGFIGSGNWPQNLLLLVSGINLLIGYGVAMGMGILGLARCSPYRLMIQVPLMPFYWLLISVATYWSVWRFVVAPFAWEKTRH
ncbi:MAG: glycosyltransferase family 2 protein, partial [Hyphomicrobiales bacterium]